jgi:hypothetical protein
MLELDKVDRAQFAEFVGQDFEIALKGAAPVNVRLVEVRSLGAAQAGSREHENAKRQFASTFRQRHPSFRRAAALSPTS